MALTILQIMDDVTLELQSGYLNFEMGTGEVVQLMTTWLDKTQKDLLHTGLWKHLLRRQTSITTTTNTSSYALSPTNIRRIEAVFDTVGQQFLSPLENVFPPSSVASPEDKPRASRPPTDTAVFRADTLFSGYYWPATIYSGGAQATTLYVFPHPQAKNLGTLTVYYAAHAPTVANGTDNENVVLDQDARDALVAGILWRAFLYLDQPAKADRWHTIYEAAKQGETVS